MSTRPRKPHRLVKILVPTDFSASSDAAVDYASFIAHRFRADIEVLYVWNPRTESRYEGRTIFFADSVAAGAMKRCLSPNPAWPAQVRGRLEFGELCSTILRVAAADDFDLIVMGLHGHTRLSHIFNGHVAQKVAHHTACPVITIRASMVRPSAPETFAAPRNGASADLDDGASQRQVDHGGDSQPLSTPELDHTQHFQEIYHEQTNPSHAGQ